MGGASNSMTIWYSIQLWTALHHYIMRTTLTVISVGHNFRENPLGDDSYQKTTKSPSEC